MDTFTADLLTETEVSKRLGYSISTLQKWRVAGLHLPFVKVGGGGVRYRPCDIEQFIERNTVGSTSEARGRNA